MTAYYNEIDPYAAQWVRNLIAAGHIAPGDVDERPIQEVKANDIRKYTQCHFFAGIGGWSYALRLAGWGDDRPVWTGSCPCQPFSVAGKAQAQKDERHLWPVWFRLIAEVSPAIVFGEQVAGAIAHGWLDDTFDDLERQGYETGAAVLPACSVGAPHKRDRLWFVGVSDSTGWKQGRQTSEAAGHGDSLIPASADAGEISNSQRLNGDNGGYDTGEVFRKQHKEAELCGSEDDVADAREQSEREPTNKTKSITACRPPRNEFSNSREFMADSYQPRLQGRDSGIMQERTGQCTARTSSASVSHTDSESQDGTAESRGECGFWEFEPTVGRVANGIFARTHKLRAYGNAIVPQVAAEFIKAFSECRA